MFFIKKLEELRILLNIYYIMMTLKKMQNRKLKNDLIDKQDDEDMFENYKE